MREGDLRALMERATDRIDPDLVAPALAGREAALHRRRRYAVGAAAAAAAAVVFGALVLDQGDQPVSPAPSPSPTVPTPTDPAPTEPTTADPGPAGPATQPLWDPFTVVDAPTRETRLATRLEPPPAAGLPTLAEQPVEGVVVAWPAAEADLRLLGTDGQWRVVPGTRDAVAGTFPGVVRPAVSPDGTRVALSAEDGIRVLDVTDGAERVIPWPEPLAPPWDTAPSLLWRPGNDGFVAVDWQWAWLVGLDGTAEPAPYPGRYPSLAVDPDGAVYQNDYQRRRLLTWEGDVAVREVPLYQCERMTARFGLVACTTGSLEPFRSGPLVVDPDTGEVVAYAPIEDENAVYSDNGHLTALGFLDRETLLLSLGPADFRKDKVGEGAWHLVAWQFRTGKFRRITTGETDLQAAAVVPALVD